MAQKTKDFVTADKLPPFPTIIEPHGFKQVGLVEKDDVSTALRLLEHSEFCDPATRLSARILRLAMEGGYKEAAEKAATDPVHVRQIFKEQENFVNKVIANEVRGLIQHELGRDQITLIPAHAEKIANDCEVAWAHYEAKRLPANFISEMANLTFGFEPADLAGSGMPLSQMLKVIRSAFDFLSRLKELEWIAHYDGPKFEDNSKKLKDAVEITIHIISSSAPLKEKIAELAVALEKSEETVKKTLREIAYASFEGTEKISPGDLEALGFPEQEVLLDFRKTPKSLNDEIRKFVYAIRAKQGLNPDACREVALEYLDFPSESDLNDLVNAYPPLARAETEAYARRILGLMEETARVKGESMGAHPVRVVSWFKQAKGRITEWEKKEVAGAPEELHSELRRAQLEYDFLYAQAACQFAKQVAELREFIKIYGAGMEPKIAGMMAELIGYDPESGLDIISDPEKAEKYLSSLEKTLARWNDLGKDFRKVPYSLERALGSRPEGVFSSNATKTAVEADLLRRIAHFHDEYEEDIAKLEELRSAKKDIVARLASISQHGKAGKRIYSDSMEVRENELGDALPKKKKGKKKNEDQESS